MSILDAFIQSTFKKTGPGCGGAWQDREKLLTPGVKWLIHITNQQPVTSHMEGICRARGYEYVWPYHYEEEQVFFVRCTPGQLQEMVAIAESRAHSFEVWQRFLSAPASVGDWWLQFSNYLSRQWFDSEHPLAAACRSFQGPAARPAIMRRIADIAKNKAAFDLNDPYIFTYWLEFLTEYPERGELWAQFEAECGPVDVLRLPAKTVVAAC